VLTGAHFIDGDVACAEGALAAGCRFAAGYPITPSTEVVERLASRFPSVGGLFIQMEDEIASSICLQGGVWGGAKAMTVTSGPGFSLMMEHVGLAVMTETPCVFVNVQRGGPSTGLPTLPGQADMMQVRWGSHGDYEVIALSPNSCQEAFNLTIDAFNLSEQYRLPVFMMLDEVVGHMLERVVIPKADEIEITPRRMTTAGPGEYLPYRVAPGEWSPEMSRAGLGHNFHITGLTHDERGYPAMKPDAQEKLVRRLVDKVRKNAASLVRTEDVWLDDAEVVVVAYGITSRVASRAVQMARAEGMKVGMLRLIVCWPFPEEKVRALASRVRGFVVPELNYGQMVYEVERCAGRAVPCRLVEHGGGTVHKPEVIFEAIREVYRHD
jgi:2-oxoglutarate ferredoxin oxidoreductase subunit alpha